jgi:hypothetical protein
MPSPNVQELVDRAFAADEVIDAIELREALEADAAADAEVLAAKDAEIAELEARIAELEGGQAPAAVLASFSVSDAPVRPEAGGPSIFTVTASEPSTMEMRVDYATVAGTATAGQDFTATSGTLVFSPGEVEKTVSVPLLNDALVESNEAFTLQLTNARLNLVLTDASGSATITSEDTTPPVEPPTSGVGLPAIPSGVGSSGALTNYTGSLNISTGGTVIENKTINGSLRISAQNVTVRNCKITGFSNWGIDADGSTGTIIDHCTMVGQSGNSCILTGANGTVTNCDLSRMDNGIMIQSGTCLVEGNYIHDLNVGGHVDGIQTGGPVSGVTIRGNWVESFDTSCIFLSNEFGLTQNVTITGNTLKNKGPTDPNRTSSTIYPNGPGIKITNNRMERGKYGYLDYERSDLVFTGNVDFVTGAPITKAMG